MRNGIFLPVVTFLVFAACSKQTDHKVEHFAVDGVPVTRTTGAPLHEGPLYELESDLVLGVDEGEPGWQIFGRGLWFTVGQDDRIYIGSYPDNVIYITNPSGERVGEFDREGSGPEVFSWKSTNRGVGQLGFWK